MVDFRILIFLPQFSYLRLCEGERETLDRNSSRSGGQSRGNFNNKGKGRGPYKPKSASFKFENGKKFSKKKE